MNTRQKLTLGIAAIFMVTLTIVGVTYAFFVTRVNTPQGETTVDVQTAKLATVEYAEGNGTVIMDDVIPGDVEYKTFKVLNKNAAQSLYTVILAAAKETGKPSFVHTTSGDVTTVCYDDGAFDLLNTPEASRTGEVLTKYNTLMSTCYQANQAYNSIKYDLYEVTKADYETASNALTEDATIEALLTADNRVSTGNVTEGTGTYADSKITVGANPQGILIDETIDAGTLNQDNTVTAHEVYYVLKVTYEEETANQNIENNAVLRILVSIK